MKSQKLIEKFLLKINTEYLEYKMYVVGKTADEIFGMAYEIDYKTRIFVLLRDRADLMPEYVLKALIKMPDLIYLIYDMWLKQPDSAEDELEEFTRKSIRIISDSAIALRKGA